MREKKIIIMKTHKKHMMKANMNLMSWTPFRSLHHLQQEKRANVLKRGMTRLLIKPLCFRCRT
jgi:hypothetical protein